MPCTCYPWSWRYQKENIEGYDTPGSVTPYQGLQVRRHHSLPLVTGRAPRAAHQAARLVAVS